MQERLHSASLRRYYAAGVLIAVVLGGMCGLMYGQGAERFLQSYLMAWVFWILLALGCLGFTLLHHSIRGVWGLGVLRLFEAGASPATFLVLGLAGIPIFANMHSLYEWTHADFMASSEALRYKQWYLNEAFFFLRLAAYFAFWIWISWFLRKSGIRQDQILDERLAQARMNWSAPMLVFFVLSVTLCMTDWVMSLDPHWFSHIFGLWLLIGGGLTAIAAVNLLIARNADVEPYKSVMSVGWTKDLGNMMFVFTLLWAYTSLSQYLIIWQGNLPEFTSYYFVRSQGGWENIALVLIFGQFLFPFVALLSPRVKRVPALLGAMATWILLMRVLDVFWIIAPFFRKGSLEVHWGPDLVAFAFLGMLWLVVFANQLMRATLIPEHDTRLKEAYHHA